MCHAHLYKKTAAKDKCNGQESKYNMCSQTKGHNWALKLHMSTENQCVAITQNILHLLVISPTTNLLDFGCGQRVCAGAHGVGVGACNEV
eukprot:scaffold379_cov71-Cyclotella_meneghiniana.AAC.6